MMCHDEPSGVRRAPRGVYSHSYSIPPSLALTHALHNPASIVSMPIMRCRLLAWRVWLRRRGRCQGEAGFDRSRNNGWIGRRRRLCCLFLLLAACTKTTHHPPMNPEASTGDSTQLHHPIQHAQGSRGTHLALGGPCAAVWWLEARPRLSQQPIIRGRRGECQVNNK